ncbi:MAG: response regulator [Nannocystaceae bacterium]
MGSFRGTARILVPFALVIVVAASLVTWALIDAGVERLSARAAVVTRGAAATLTSVLSKSTDHLHSLGSEHAVRSALNHSDDPDALDSLLPAFSTLLTRNPTYRQARWIDESGRERLRVVRGDDGSVRASPDLQNKSGRYYVSDGLASTPGLVIVSSLDLNVEYGEIEEPWVPTLRFVMRVENDRAEPHGLLVINVDMQPLFTQLEANARAERLELSLLNSRGEWLFGAEPDALFAFMYDREVRLDRRQPALWQQVSAAPQGRTSKAGIWAWTQVEPLSDERPTGERPNQTPWVLLAHVDDADVRRLYTSIIAPSVLISLLLLGLFGGVARRLAEREHSLREARDRAEAANQAAALVSEIATAANAAMDAHEMVYLSLRPLCEATGIGVAVAMFGEEVGMHYIKSAADPGAVGDALRSLDESPWLRDIRYAKEPLWLDFNDTSSLESAAPWCRKATEAGLAGALGIPIVVDGEPIASCVLLYDGSYRYHKHAFTTIVRAGADALAAEVVNVLLRERANAELTEARKSAEESNQAKTEFLAHMSHELRTPLNGVIGAARLLRGELSVDERRQFVQVIEESGSHLLALINEILDVGKIESGEITFVDEDVDVIDVVDRSLLGLRSLADSKGVRLQHLADPAMTGMCRADATRITQIITNLVGNALKFTDRGKVVVRTGALAAARPRELHLQIAIEDSGRGIPKESLRRIFERYVQAKSDDPRRPEGVGLGLHISKLLIEAMSGSIVAESPNPNNRIDTPGSRFLFDVVVQRSRLPQPYTPLSRGARLRIWVVEEDEELGRHLVEVIQSWGPTAVYHRGFPERGTPPPDVVVHNAAIPAPAWIKSASAYAEPVSRRDLYSHLVPLAADAEVEETDAESVIDRITAHNRERRRVVLLVEDNPVNQLILSKFLEMMGFAVVTVDNGRDALDRFADAAGDGPPDVVLMDCNMPVMSGIEATRRLRARGVVTPIIAVTADVMADELQHCLDADMDDYISKPVDLNLLATVLLRRLFA